MTPAERQLFIAIARVLYGQTGDYDLARALEAVEQEPRPDEIERMGRRIRENAVPIIRRPEAKEETPEG